MAVAFNSANKFLIESVGIQGVEFTEAEDGILEVSVPRVLEDASLFIIDRPGLKRFYELVSAVGQFGLRLDVDGIGTESDLKQPIFKLFDVAEIRLPEDAAEYSLLAEISQQALSQLAPPSS